MRAQTIHGKTHHSTTTLKNKNKNGGNPVFIGVHLYKVRIHDLLREGVWVCASILKRRFRMTYRMCYVYTNGVRNKRDLFL
jgi:hypothetical protein